MEPHQATLEVEAPERAPSATRSVAAPGVVWWHHALILALALVTRGALWDNATGEPDR